VCTVSMISSLIYENLKGSRDHKHVLLRTVCHL